MRMVVSPGPQTASRRRVAAAILAIAATYLYFLLFAEFAFLELATAIAPTATTQRFVLFALGLGGVSGALLGARRFRSARAGRMLTHAFRGCALGALLALVPLELAGLIAAAGLTGVSLGALTVTLASVLRQAIGPRHLGLAIGGGTGAAYALCNIPAIFHASPATQALIAAAVAVAASGLPRFMQQSEGVADAGVADDRTGIRRWVAILLALVWLDSAAFYIVQHTDTLRAATWNDPRTLWRNAVVHLLVALAAGALLDRGRRVLAVGSAAALLGVAALVLDGTLPGAVPAGVLYVAGVSLYSVALVEFPARTGRPWVAALVFAVAGWIGSACGIGMAQDLARIPPAFVAVASAVIAVALVWRRRRIAAAVALVFAAGSSARADDAALGREVYIAEGCIHCHSQFIRPRVPLEVLNWGPARPLGTTLAAAPPLIGTRRQGPDLSNVGNRRSPEWNRLHLIAPQAISPGSRMPSYAHLFARDNSRGDALLAYLASLGADTFAERQQQIAAWRPDTRAVIAPAAAQRLFARLCAQCHGEAGGGDGALAAQLSVRPPDWTRALWRHVRASEDPEVALSRIIKFGVPGLPMAGHEYLPDAEIVGLARHVRSLYKSGGGVATAAIQP